jgi:hypothetical protein
MLGCHDFCGHYEWTFDHVRKHFGQDAVHRLWAEAIGGESQDHYRQAASAAGLRGLFDTWNGTGEDEHCVWSLTLNEDQNVFRIDMRECPSKGFLQNNDLNADEDYCDHCIGWVAPLLAGQNMEVARHEHNHRGQCWWEMRSLDRGYQTAQTPVDIRNDPRWKHGYLDRFDHHRRLPLFDNVDQSTDPCDVLTGWFARRGNSIATDRDYHTGAIKPAGVVIDHPPADLRATADRFLGTPPAGRPLLMHAYLPGSPPIDFVSAGLPRPVPILPLLIRTGVYSHQPGTAHPSSDAFVKLIAAALRMEK